MTMEAVYFIVSAETEDREAAYKLRDDIEILIQHRKMAATVCIQAFDVKPSFGDDNT